MPFLGSPQSQARKPFAEVLPDGRKRLTRYFKVNTTGVVPPELNYAPGTADAWTDAPSGWTGLLLTYKQFRDSERGFPQGAEDDKPIVQLIFEQISATGETQTAGIPQTQLTDGRDQVEFTYVMFSTSTYSPQTPGTSTAPSPFTSYYLWLEETTDDGTLRNIKRTYQTAGTTATDDESLQGGALLTKKITSFHAVPSTPSGYTSVGTPVQNPNGYPIYTYTFAKGSGLVLDEKHISASGVLVIYHRIALGTAPTTPTATISGTVTLFDSSLKHDDGFDTYDYRWAEGNGHASVETRGEPDGALLYSIIDYGVSAATPSYPGSGTAYLISLDNRPENGYFINSAIYKKPPADQTRRQTIEWQKPGVASFTSQQLTLSPPTTRTLLASVLVTYSTTQDTSTPFSVSAYASLIDSFIQYTKPGASPTPGTPPADISTAVPSAGQRGLSGYLSGATSISGTNDFYNGVFCLVYSAVLVSSTPSSLPSGATVLRVENDPYITDTNGTIVYRITKTSFTF